MAAASASGSDGLWSAFLGGTSPRLLLEDIYRASRAGRGSIAPSRVVRSRQRSLNQLHLLAALCPSSLCCPPHAP